MTFALVYKIAVTLVFGVAVLVMVDDIGKERGPLTSDSVIAAQILVIALLAGLWWLV